MFISSARAHCRYCFYHQISSGFKVPFVHFIQKINFSRFAIVGVCSLHSFSHENTYRERQHPTIFSWIFFPFAFIVWQQKLNAAHSLHWWYNRIQLLLPRNKRWAAFCIKCASQLWMQIFMIIEYLEMNILNAGWLQTNATIAAYWLTLARWSGKASIELSPFTVFKPIWAQGNVIQNPFLRIFHC